MNGARMRSYSLSGTRPEKISRSVPRLSALATARTRTSPAAERRDRLGADFRLAGRDVPERLARCSELDCHLIPNWTSPHAARYILRGPKKHPPNDRTHHRLRRRPPADPLAGRRIFFALIVLASMVGLIWLLSFALSAGGFGVVDFILVVMFAVTLPWSVIGFWNATIGLFLMRFSADPVAAVTPVSARVRGDEPITAKTAILWCVRNEDTERVIRNIEPMMEGLAASGAAGQFHVFILSDTNYPEIAAVEEPRFAALKAKWEGRLALTYRRRTENTGFKAGNICDFCTRWGADYDFAVTLDADSFQTAESILRMVRIMQIEPKLGILQSLVVGMPSTSAFARIFQFGMRLGMRSYTLGSAWWQGDCGPYWGHNAIIRIAPFIAHCHLPPRPDGTHNPQPRPDRGAC